MIDVLLLAMTQVSLASYEPDFIVVNPLDWARVMAMKDADGDYINGSPFAPEMVARRWTLPIIPTLAMTAGSVLVGAGTAARYSTVRMRRWKSAPNTRTSSLATSSCCEAEERLGLAVHRPEAFVKGTFTTAITAATAV